MWVHGPLRVGGCLGGVKQFPWKFTEGAKQVVHHAREARAIHEKICRGSIELTRVCPYCDQQFPESISDEYLVNHRKKCSHRPNDAPSLSKLWPCPNCKARIPLGRQEEHVNICRGSAKANRTCSLCSHYFQTVDQRVRHEESCRGSTEANLTCSKCNQLFKTWGNRIAHEKACKGGGPS